MSLETLIATLALIDLIIVVAALLWGAVERSGLPRVLVRDGQTIVIGGLRDQQR